MVSLNPIGSSSSLAAASSAALQRSGPPAGKGPLDAVSSVLGMSADEIASAVSSGSSLMDLAEEKGVSSEDLLNALKEGAPDDLRNSANIDDVVAQIANQKGPGGPGGPGGPPPGPPPPGGVLAGGQLTSGQQSTLETLSSLLEMSTDDLASTLRSGTSLTDLLEQKGVDLSTLASSLEKGVVVDLRA